MLWASRGEPALDTSCDCRWMEWCVRERRQLAYGAGGVALLAVVAVATVLAAAPWLLGQSDGPAVEQRPQSASDAGGASIASTSAASVSATSGAGAGSASATPSATVSAEPSATVIEIGWVGDLTPGSKYGNPPDDGRALFEHTRDYLLEPDVMVANLEGTFGNGGPSKCDGKDSSQCYAFQAPPKNAESLAWAGIDVVNLANNHTRDYLERGIKSTRKALDANEIAYTGLNDTIAIQEVDGVRVAFLGFSPYSWSPDIGDLKAAKKLVKAADEDADVVVVLMHAGAEGADKTRTPKGAERAYGEFRGDSRAFSRAVIDAGADLVLGSGPHVVRGMEQYKGRLIAYSLGNFAGWRNFSRAGKLSLSGLLTVQVDAQGKVLGGRWRSLKIVEPGVPKVDKKRTSAKLVQELSNKDFESPVQLEDDGTFTFETE